MIGATTTITDRATPVIIAIAASVRPELLKPIIGRAVVNLFRQHLFAVDASHPNALGGERTHFYSACARATHFDVLPDGVQISVNQVGFRQRVLGGTITPRSGKKYLTIPARAEAHGKRASEFNDLVVVFGAGGVPIALARAGQSLISHTRNRKTGAVGATPRGSAGGEILFWLRKSVTQQGDPSVVPSLLDIGAAVHTNVNAFVARNVARARQQTGGPS